jgi:phytanoyl-CoA hydroxylase
MVYSQTDPMTQPWTAAQREQFQAQGYLVVPALLSVQTLQPVLDRLDPLFHTQFETGVYPDEWYGRPGLSQPHATRQMVGLWRCDRAIASLTLSAEIARRNATLMGWTGGRYGLDSCWIKPPGAPAVSFHRNHIYTACLNPGTSITCWIALSDAPAAAGSLQVVPGSHQWPGRDRLRFLHAPSEDYRTPLWAAAQAAGIDHPDILTLDLAAGDTVFFHSDLWHGSGPNTSTDQTRASLAITTLAADTTFQPLGVGDGYIFNRYRRMDSLVLDDSYFPLLWSVTGDRSPMVQAYTDDALVPQGGRP